MVFIGADARKHHTFRGSLAMLQIYDNALGTAAVRCAFESGRRLIQSGQMAQSVDSDCRRPLSTGCTSPFASGSPATLFASVPEVDDGSCHFDEHPTVSETGVIAITDSWQRVLLTSSAYTRPIVFTGVLSRQSTAQAVLRIGDVKMDESGRWSFTIRAEQESCHFAKPPSTAERVSYLVVEAGVSQEGWQAGGIRIDDQEWHRVSLLHLFDSAVGGNPAPVVISHQQNFDPRMQSVTTRHNMQPDPITASAQEAYQGFFIQVQGTGVWCPDNHYFTEYFDNLELVGSPVETLCESTVPDWHWHSCCGGVPPAMEGRGYFEKPFLFSTRWTSRIHTREDSTFRFLSLASGGSRIFLDEATVLDAWEEYGSTLTSDPVPMSAGYHNLVYEYRSADSLDATPTNSYAVLKWVSAISTATGAGNYTDTVASGVTAPLVELYADVGWLACATGNGAMNSQQLEAGFVSFTRSPVRISFGAGFVTAPLVFATLISTDRLSAHLRLLEAGQQHASIATEYDTCNFVVDNDDHLLGWIAMALPAAIGAVESKFSRRLTNSSDVIALLSIRESLGLPDYLQWHNGSDPCSDRWAGIECRAATGKEPRVVVLDVRPLAISTPCTNIIKQL
jgi:hypothetical protein